MKEIKVLHPFFVPVSRRQVWTFLWDVQAVASCIPGCQAVLIKEADRSYEASIRRKVGVFLVEMKLDIQVLRRIPLESITVEVSGHDVRLKSEFRQTLGIQLVDDADGTRVSIHAALTIEGMLATISKYLIEMQIKQVLNDFAENFVLELNKKNLSLRQPR
jgi:carbon monoxide dehydrogenase subunit G